MMPFFKQKKKKTRFWNTCTFACKNEVRRNIYFKLKKLTKNFFPGEFLSFPFSFSFIFSKIHKSLVVQCIIKKNE